MDDIPFGHEFREARYRLRSPEDKSMRLATFVEAMNSTDAAKNLGARYWFGTSGRPEFVPVLTTTYRQRRQQRQRYEVAAGRKQRG